ncbi:MAG: hypothetical protein JW987_02425 [Anaerolineaceae bacterium]|nr:hypothetical protein [Anaerolineaceae bacterium]
MADNSRSLTNQGGFFQGISDRARLIIRLMGDKRVSPLIKLLPLGTLVYLVVPTDLMPIVPLDDAAVIWLGTYLFVELCPPDVVQEHTDNLERARQKDILADNPDAPVSGDVIDAEFHETDRN